jgi:hypothetical protein
MVNKTLMSTHCITALRLQHQLCDLVDYTDALAETDCNKASQASSKENSRLSCCFANLLHRKKQWNERT